MSRKDKTNEKYFKICIHGTKQNEYSEDFDVCPPTLMQHLLRKQNQ